MSADGSLPAEMHALVPFWGMAGGVIKLLDYVGHALEAGVERIRLWGPPLDDRDVPLLTVPRVRALVESDRVHIDALDHLEFAHPDPWILFTEPAHHRHVERALSTAPRHRLIHLVQGTRHANAEWNGGLHYRLLHRPMTRVVVSEQVARAVEPHVNTRFPTRTIVEGHDLDFFARGAPDRAGSRSTHRVLYTTWKSDLGDRIAELESNNPSLTFDAIRRECGWPELRRRYHDADFFVCTPGPEEGFYLPGIEAMAAGCVVVGAAVGGNAAYMDADRNALVVDYDAATDHAEALRVLAADTERAASLRTNARSTVAAHDLRREAAEFADLLGELAEMGSGTELT